MRISAHIPTQTYGFIQIDDLPDNPKEIERLYNIYSEKPISLVSDLVRLDAFVGDHVMYNPLRHEYFSDDGVRYISGSEFAHQNEKPFDKEKISEAMAKKHDVVARDIVDFWEKNGEVSRTLGTALHAAMELYGKYSTLATKMGKDAVHANPMVNNAVKSFYEAHKEKAEYEVVVVDHEAKRAGRVDRLAILGKKICRVEDFKTDNNIKKSLEIYQKQLSFYANILVASGWTVKPSIVYHWTGEKWDSYEMEVIKV